MIAALTRDWLGCSSRYVPKRTGMALSIAALVPIGAALALAVPGKFGAAQLMLAAAGVTAWSLIVLMVPSTERERIVGFFTAAAVVGSGVLLAAGAELLWQLPILTYRCRPDRGGSAGDHRGGSAFRGVGALPAAGHSGAGDPTPSAPAFRVLEDLPRRVRIGDAHQSGFIAGAVLLGVLGSVAIALRPGVVERLGWYVVAAIAAMSVLRARVWDSAACKAWLLAQPFLVAGVLLVFYAATGRFPAALIAAAVLVVLVLGVGRGGAEPGHRLAGNVFAAAAPVVGLCRDRSGCFADPRHRLFGRSVRLGAQSMIRAGFACLSAALVFSQAVMPWACPPASAISQPVVDPGVQPPSGAAGPVQPMEQRGPCSASGVIAGQRSGSGDTPVRRC